MRSIRQYRDTARKERDRADALRKEAEGHRNRIGTFSADTDPKLLARESDTAQKLVERAAQHDQTALQAEQDAANLEQKTVEIERQEQELQASTQATINKLEGEKKALQG